MVESSGLENRRTGNRTVGSNPTSSATGNVPVRLLAPVMFEALWPYVSSAMNSKLAPYKRS